MEDGFYTLARWKVKPGLEEQFIQAWKEMGEVFLTLPRPATQGTLVRSMTEPSVFFSFGPWKDSAEIEAMRTDLEAKDAMQRVIDLCEEATPGTYEVVAEIRN